MSWWTLRKLRTEKSTYHLAAIRFQPSLCWAPVELRMWKNTGYWTWITESEGEVAQSCPTLCNSMDCSLPGSSIHGILQARVLEWDAISFSRGSSWPGDRTRVFHTAGRRFSIWVTREVIWVSPRSDLSEPRLLHLPIHSKVLISLTWDIFFFFLISNNLLMFRLPAPCCKMCIYLTPPLASLEQFSQGYLSCYLLGLKA